MTHASVFSGIGGPEVAAAMLGWDNLFHCEINPFGRSVLQYWFPKSKSYEDITKTDFSEWGGKVNVLTGGFPCQPFSYAGQRRGADDDRYLWPFMHRCINQVRPDWVVCENVAGILTMVEQGDVTEMAAEKSLFSEVDTLHRYRLDETFTLERICQDLENDGYAVQAVVIPACSVGAPHRRDRVFIIGHRNDAENAMCSGQLHGQHDIAGSERNIGDACTGNCERLCGETSGFHVADTSLMHLNGCQPGDGCDGSRQPKPEFGSRDCTATERGITPDPACNRSAPQGESSTLNGSRPDKFPCQTRQRERHASIIHNGLSAIPRDALDTKKQRGQRDGLEQPGTGREKQEQSRGRSGQDRGIAGCGRWQWSESGRWLPTQSPVHRGNDGIPFPLDDLTISPSKWRTESLKAYGNAIVPQVMYEIFKAIEATYD